MKIRLTLLFIALISITSFAQKDIKTNVKEAIVFSNNAQITRFKTLKLKPGQTEIRFIGLEKNINANSIQISGNAGVTIISNQFKLINTPDSYKPKEMKRLEDSIAVLQRKIALNNNLSRNYQSEKNVILKHNNVKGNNTSFVVEDLQDLTKFYRDNLQKLDVLIYDLRIVNTKLNKKKNDLNTRIRKIEYERTMGTITVKILSDAKRSIKLRFSYIANNVGWTPSYVINSNGVGSDVLVSSKATIFQNTGVTWNNVKLKLSTGNPMNYGVLPTIHPWVLRFRREYSKNRRVPQKKSYSMPNQMNTRYDLAEKDIKSNSLSYFTKATSGMMNREFSISLPYSVKGRNGKAVVELEKFQMESDYVYYTAPKYDKSVYLIANIDDWEQHNLLPGNATIFVEETYVGNTFINPNVTKDTMSLMLGKDRNIVVDRKKLKQLSKTSFFGGKKRTEMAMQLVIKNKKGRNIDIVVEDQVPISHDEKIEINVKDVSGAKHNKTNGTLTWKYTLRAGQTKQHKIIYEVKHPKDKVLENF